MFHRPPVFGPPANDDESVPGFPKAVDRPGTVTDTEPTTAPLVLYRLFRAGDVPVGNSMRARSISGGVELSF